MLSGDQAQSSSTTVVGNSGPLTRTRVLPSGVITYNPTSPATSTSPRSPMSCPSRDQASSRTAVPGSGKPLMSTAGPLASAGATHNPTAPGSTLSAENAIS